MASPPPDTPPIARLARPDGRWVGWRAWGPADGAPVLLCAGAATSSALGVDVDALAACGARLICVDRAGLGGSSPDPHKSFARWCDDVAAVLRHLAIAPPPVIGCSQGAPFAVALAGAGLAARLALVAGQDELAHPPVRAQLIPPVAAMVDAIAADVAAFEADFATRVDAAGMLALVLAMSGPGDRAYYQRPAFAAAYRAALDEGFAQGAAGYVRDVTLAMRPWPVPPEAIATPVTLWYGGADTSPVHSPDHGAGLAARFPRATRRLLPDEGGAILWTQTRAILADCLDDPAARPPAPMR